MAKLPSFQFYPGDWFKDPDLRRCSKAAKGVWIDMICLSFECKERGVFSAGAGAWSDHEIAVALGGDIAENLSAIEELLAKGVCSRNESGAIFCRRVVRDEQIRRVKAANGSQGGRPKTKPQTKPKPKRKQNQTTSSSSSSSASSKPPYPPEGGSPKPAGISKEGLGEIAKLREWFDRRHADFGLKSTVPVFVWVIAASERALDVGDDPVGLFVSLIAELAAGNTSKLEAYYDRAKQRIREENPSASLADSKGIDDDELA